MKGKIHVCIAILLMVASISNAQTNKSMQNKNFTPEQNAVMNALLEMTSSFHKKDINGVMSSYEQNAVIVFAPEKPVSDPTAIREEFYSFFALNPKFEYSGHEVFVNGNIAIHFAPWTMTGKTPDGTDVKQSGLSVAVFRKQSDGKWLMIFDNPFGQHLLDQR
jgi:ketosteroid isomerase-like protein